MHHLHQSISLTTNNDLSGAVNPATEVKIKFMQLHSMCVFFGPSPFQCLKIVRLFMDVTIMQKKSLCNHHLIYFIQSRDEGCKSQMLLWSSARNQILLLQIHYHLIHIKSKAPLYLYFMVANLFVFNNKIINNMTFPCALPMSNSVVQRLLSEHL